MNANININNYYTNQISSSDIRRAYIQSSRRRDAIAFIKSSLKNPTVWHTLFVIKIMLGLISAISLFAVMGSIESGELSFLSGIIAALVIAFVECLCFIPIGKRPKSRK